MPQMNLNIMPVIIILQAAESAFICCCCQYPGALRLLFDSPSYLVVFAVWKASRSTVEQGRMSISLSMDVKDHDTVALDGDGRVVFCSIKAV